MTPIHIEEKDKDGSNIVVTSRAYIVPHAEEGGAHAPTGGIFVSLQEIPQDITYGGKSTINEQHDCETLQMEEEGREEG